MKNLLFFAFIFIAASCNRYFPVDEMKYGGMNGNVQSAKMSQYEADKKFGEVIKDEDELTLVTLQKFDKNGNLIEKTDYNRYGKETYEGFFTYEDGYATESIEKYNKNEIKGKRVELSKNYSKWEYEGMDFKSVEICFDNILVDGCYHKIMKNEKGTIVNEKLIRKNGIVVLTRNFDNDGDMTYEEVNKLNDDNLITETMLTFDNSVETYSILLKYEYLSFDKHGNWTKRIMDKSGDLYIEEREIIYR